MRAYDRGFRASRARARRCRSTRIGTPLPSAALPALLLAVPYFVTDPLIEELGAPGEPEFVAVAGGTQQWAFEEFFNPGEAFADGGGGDAELGGGRGEARVMAQPGVQRRPEARLVDGTQQAARPGQHSGAGQQVVE